MNSRTQLQRIAHLALLSVTLIYMVGCGGTKQLQVTVMGSTDLNSGGNAARIYVYELTNDTNFKEVPLESFWENPEAALGNELINSQQILLYPDRRETIFITPTEEMQYVGVAADLRQPDREGWRQVYSKSEIDKKGLVVQVGENSVTLSIQ